MLKNKLSTLPVYLRNQWRLQWYLHPFRRAKIWENYRHHSRNTLCLVSQPRSGSTWLAELLMHIPKSVQIDEPLWRGFYRTDGRMPESWEGKLDAVKHLNFYFNQPIPEKADWPEARAFFHDLLNLNIVHPSIFGQTPLSRLRQGQFFIFKFNYASLLLPWLVNQVDARFILLLRHPCAVVASQLKHFAFREVRQHPHFLIPSCRFCSFFENYNAILKEVRSPEENLPLPGL
ncbi:MAG: sulfotransferase [Bacteroidia bacterium]|nr:sulfotransferase [Bacteroidia bacterium]